MNSKNSKNYYYGCVSRISLHQAHIELNNGIVDVAIPFTEFTELSDSIILVLKLNTNFRNNSLKDRMFRFTNISEALLSRAYLRGEVQGVQTPPPPPEIFRFFLKSEGKEVERKRKKMRRDGRGGVNC